MPAVNYQEINRQLGELTVEMRALRADQERQQAEAQRHGETTDAVKETVIDIRLELARMKGEKRATAIITRTLMSVGAIIGGGISGMFGHHLGILGGH